MSTPTVLSNTVTPPLRFSRGTYSEGERLTIRQAGIHISFPTNEADNVIEAIRYVAGA
jgi:hypothetical protein